METLLLVEDDPTYREALSRALVRAGFAPTVCGGVEEALVALESILPDFAIVDLKLADGSGIDVIDALARAAPGCRSLLLSGHATVPAAVAALRAGAVDVVEKPASTSDLVARLRRAPPPGPLAGSSPKLEEVERAHIDRVLAEHGGNVTLAAEALGIDRRTLQRKLGRRDR